MEKSITIRPYQKDDHDQIQKVCLETGYGQELPPKPMQDMLLTAFCNYYIEEEPENCFVAADGDTAVGYILCAKDTVFWSGSFLKKYVPDFEVSPLKPFYQGIMEAPLKFAGQYPAHLHIDILPEYQRMGIGFRLMDALTAHLKGQGVPGLMLSVAGDNEKGKNFYKKYGFGVLEETEHEIVMGILL